MSALLLVEDKLAGSMHTLDEYWRLFMDIPGVDVIAADSLEEVMQMVDNGRVIDHAILDMQIYEHAPSPKRSDAPDIEFGFELLDHLLDPRADRMTKEKIVIMTSFYEDVAPGLDRRGLLDRAITKDGPPEILRERVCELLGL